MEAAQIRRGGTSDLKESQGSESQLHFFCSYRPARQGCQSFSSAAKNDKCSRLFPEFAIIYIFWGHI